MRPPLLLLPGLLLLVSGPAGADADAEKKAQRAREAEQEALGDDVVADRWMRVIADGSATRAQLVEAHLRSGVLALGRGEEGSARRHFQSAIALDPAAQLGVDAPPGAADLLEEVRGQRRPSPTPVPPPAPTVPPPAASGGPSPATGPPPDGPPRTLASDDEGLIGWISLGTGVVVVGLGLTLLTGGCIAGTLALLAHVESANEPVQRVRAAAYDRRDIYATLANTAFVVGAALTAAGGVATGAALLWVVLE